FVEKKVKKLLLIEDDKVQLSSLTDLIAGDDVQVVPVSTAGEAREALEAGDFDCVVLDLMLEDLDAGTKLLEDLKTQPRFRDLPIVVYTGKELAKKEEQRLKRYAESVILKS